MQCASGSHAVFVGIDRPLVRGHSNQVRGPLRGRVKLDPCHVGRPVHPHTAVRAWQCGDPLNRVVPVFRVIHPGEEPSFGLVSPAAVLRHGDVTVTSEETDDVGPPAFLVVGRPHQQRWVSHVNRLAILRGIVHVGCQSHAVPHFDHHITLDDNIANLTRGFGGVGSCGAGRASEEC